MKYNFGSPYAGVINQRTAAQSLGVVGESRVKPECLPERRVKNKRKISAKQIQGPRTCCGCSKVIESNTPSSFLCGDCLIVNGTRFGNREDPLCADCKGQLQDPAVERQKYVFADSRLELFEGAVKLYDPLKKYLCSWCRLINHKEDSVINPFISTRVGNIPIEEGLGNTYRKDFPWWVGGEIGSDWGDRWSDYYIQYAGLVIHEFVQPLTVEEARRQLGYVIRVFPIMLNESLQFIEIHRVRLFYKFSRAYVDIRYVRLPKAELKNFEQVQSPKEIQPVWESLALQGLIDAGNSEAAKAFAQAYDKTITELLMSGEDPTQNRIAPMLGLGRRGHGDEGKRQLQRGCRKYGINHKEIVSYWKSKI